jgi:pimeloyl-ACP methyl ester carboxylesterase
MISAGGLFLGFAVLVGAIGIAGVRYQASATRRDAARFPAPGRMVDVGGYRLHMQVKGEAAGGPTIVLEAGLDSFSTNWYWVQTALASTMRVVAYDRAGLGWSDDGVPPRDAYRSAADLHTALHQAGISGPYVLAGHSYGGLVVRAFADQYPDEVVGLVLVDASHHDQWLHIPMSMRGTLPGFANRVLAVLAGFGLLRVVDVLTPQIAMGLPERQYAEMQAIIARPRSSWTGGQTLSAWDELTRPRIDSARSLGDLPLAVVSVTEQPLVGETLTKLQDELPGLSSNSVHRTVLGATHEELISKREHAEEVAAAIRDVVEAAVTGAPVVEIAQPAHLELGKGTDDEHVSRC